MQRFPSDTYSWGKLWGFEFSSVAQSCLILCNPMDCSMPGLSVYHQLPELTHTQSIELVMPSNDFIFCHSGSSHLQSFPASGSFQISQVFASGGQSTGVSAWTSVLPMNTQDWFPLGWTGWISLQKGRSIQLFYVLCLLPAQCMPSLGVNWNLERIHIQSLLCNKMIFMKYSVLFVCYLFAM